MKTKTKKSKRGKEIPTPILSLPPIPPPTFPLASCPRSLPKVPRAMKMHGEPPRHEADLVKRAPECRPVRPGEDMHHHRLLRPHAASNFRHHDHPRRTGVDFCLCLPSWPRLSSFFLFNLFISLHLIPPFSSALFLIFLHSSLILSPFFFHFSSPLLLFSSFPSHLP